MHTFGKRRPPYVCAKMVVSASLPQGTSGLPVRANSPLATICANEATMHRWRLSMFGGLVQRFSSPTPDPPPYKRFHMWLIAFGSIGFLCHRSACFTKAAKASWVEIELCLLSWSQSHKPDKHMETTTVGQKKTRPTLF